MMRARSLAAGLALAACAALPLSAQTPIAVGQTVRGSLASSDAVLEDGSYYDLYSLRLGAGQTVTITLRSDAFDAFLAVGRMSGGEMEVMESDDDSGGGTDSRVVLRASAAGTYTIRANSLSEGETGAYSLEVAAGGEADDEPRGRDMVTMLLDSATSMMGAGGFAPRSAASFGMLENGDDVEITIQVSGGGVLGFVGVCDESCSDLDLTVFGPNGDELGADLLPDDAPIVRVENARAGAYRVRVSMASCGAAGGCNFGVRAYGQR